MQTPVHSFWVGVTLPAPQVACIQSFLRHGHPYRLYTYQNYSNVPDGTEVRDAGEIVPQRVFDRWMAGVDTTHAIQTFSNFFRYTLLWSTGGWWVDTDLYCLKPLPTAEYVFTSVHDIPTRGELVDLNLPRIGGNIANGFFKVPIGSTLMRRASELLAANVEIPSCPVVFGKWGTVLLTRLVVEEGLYPQRVNQMVGNGYTTISSLYDDPNMPIPSWAYVLHLYNYANVKIDPVPGCAYLKILAGEL